MKTRIWFVAIIVIVLALTATVAVAGKSDGKGKPESYLGKYQMTETMAFSWTVTPDYAPSWSVYRAGERGWEGLFRCTDCMQETSPGLWTDEVPLIEGWFVEGFGYLICGEAPVGGVMQYDAWTFRIGGGPSVHSDVASDCA